MRYEGSCGCSLDLAAHPSVHQGSRAARSPSRDSITIQCRVFYLRVERSARADDASASQTTSEEYAAFRQVSDSRAPRKRFAEGSTYRKRYLYGEALTLFGVVIRGLVLLVVLLFIGVIPDNSVIEITFVCSSAGDAGSTRGVPRCACAVCISYMCAVN